MLANCCYGRATLEENELMQCRQQDGCLTTRNRAPTQGAVTTVQRFGLAHFGTGS